MYVFDPWVCVHILRRAFECILADAKCLSQVKGSPPSLHIKHLYTLPYLTLHLGPKAGHVSHIH